MSSWTTSYVKCSGDVGGESSILSVFVLLPLFPHSYIDAIMSDYATDDEFDKGDSSSWGTMVIVFRDSLPRTES